MRTAGDRPDTDPKSNLRFFQMSKKNQQVKKTIAMLGQHVKGLVSHTLDVSEYGFHGHAAGR